MSPVTQKNRERMKTLRNQEAETNARCETQVGIMPHPVKKGCERQNEANKMEPKILQTTR